MFENCSMRYIGRVNSWITTPFKGWSIIIDSSSLCFLYILWFLSFNLFILTSSHHLDRNRMDHSIPIPPCITVLCNEKWFIKFQKNKVITTKLTWLVWNLGPGQTIDINSHVLYVLKFSNSSGSRFIACYLYWILISGLIKSN